MASLNVANRVDDSVLIYLIFFPSLLLPQVIVIKLTGGYEFMFTISNLFSCIYLNVRGLRDNTKIK